MLLYLRLALLLGALSATLWSKIAPPSPPVISARWKGRPQTPTLVVLHSTVTSTIAGAARAVARFFAAEDNKTSAHYVVDAKEVIQCVGDHTEAYHCGYNHDSIAIEMCDMPVLASMLHWFTGGKITKVKDAHGRRITPLRALEPSHRLMLRKAARLAARLCLAYDIPIRTLTDDQLRAWDKAGRPAHLGGIVTHAQMSRVFHASSHWDPGAWPSDVFMRRTRLAAKQIQKQAAA